MSTLNCWNCCWWAGCVLRQSIIFHQIQPISAVCPRPPLISLTYTDIALAIICFNRRLINHIKRYCRLICAFPLRRNRRGWSGTFTSTAGRRSASPRREKAWLRSSPQCRDSSSSLGTIPSLCTAGIYTHIQAFYIHGQVFLQYLQEFLCLCLCAAVLVQGEQVRSLHWAISWSGSRQKACWTCSKLWRVYACRGHIWSKLWWVSADMQPQ